jgi:hypothetical protein
MGIAGSPDILQGKFSELMESLDHVQAYLDDLLCISRSVIGHGIGGKVIPAKMVRLAES